MSSIGCPPIEIRAFTRHPVQYDRQSRIVLFCTVVARLMRPKLTGRSSIRNALIAESSTRYSAFANLISESAGCSISTICPGRSCAKLTRPLGRYRPDGCIGLFGYR